MNDTDNPGGIPENKTKRDYKFEHLSPDEKVRLKLEEIRLRRRYANAPWHMGKFVEDPERFKQLLGSYIPSWQSLMEDEYIASLVSRSIALKKFRLNSEKPDN